MGDSFTTLSDYLNTKGHKTVTQKKNSPLEKFSTEKRPNSNKNQYGKKSYGKKSSRRSVLKVKFLQGRISLQQNAFTTKGPYGKNSHGEGCGRGLE